MGGECGEGGRVVVLVVGEGRGVVGGLGRGDVRGWRDRVEHELFFVDYDHRGTYGLFKEFYFISGLRRVDSK